MSHPALTRRIAHILAGHAARGLPETRAAWGDPMRAEVDAIENDLAALNWAAGCLLATYGERISPMKTMSLAPFAGIAGIIIVVFGSYALAAGPLNIIAEASPPLFITIALGAIAATSILSSNGGPGVFQSLRQAFRGRRFQATDYGVLAATLAGVLAGKEAVTRGDTASCLIADAKLLADRQFAGGAAVDAAQVTAFLQMRIAAISAGESRGVRVLELLARTLLWFSAMAFVLGAIKIMISVTEVPEVIGGMLAHALVAPLLGVFLGAGIVYPLAQRLAAGLADDANIYTVIRTAVLARLAGVDPANAVRIACGGLPADLRGESL